MEASENTALPRGGGQFSPHRIDPDRVSRVVSHRADPAGYARLQLMVGTIFDRIVAGPAEDQGRY